MVFIQLTSPIPPQLYCAGRTQAVQELKGTVASPDDRLRMLEMLQRLPNAGSGSSGEDSEEDPTADVLSGANLAQLQLVVPLQYQLQRPMLGESRESHLLEWVLAAADSTA